MDSLENGITQATQLYLEGNKQGFWEFIGYHPDVYNSSEIQALDWVIARLHRDHAKDILDAYYPIHGTETGIDPQKLLTLKGKFQ